MKDTVSNIPSTIVRYFKFWFLTSKNAFLVTLSNKTVFSIFLVGKIIRFTFFFLFLFFLVKGAGGVKGYSVSEIAFFFLTFNLIDLISQFLYRDVYRFRPKVISGKLDLTLVKPINSLFTSLMGGADIIDLILLPPLIVAIYFVGKGLDPTIIQSTFYILLIINGLLIATAFHIAVLGLGIITLEIDHTVMIYRDITNLGRFPIDIYKEPLKGILTFLIPVGIMITLPAKALMGLVSPIGVIGSFVLGGVLMYLSILFWNKAMKLYTSASS